MIPRITHVTTHANWHFIPDLNQNNTSWKEMLKSWKTNFTQNYQHVKICSRNVTIVIYAAATRFTAHWTDDQVKGVVLLQSHCFQWHAQLKEGVLHHAHCSRDEN